MMNRNCLQLLAATTLVAALAGCQAPTPNPFIPGDAWVQKLSSGYVFTEGPAYDGKGNVYFTDIPNERIMRYNLASQEATVFREDSGRANGLFFDEAGNLYACEGGARRVTRIHRNTGEAKILATHYGMNRLNSPNDLVLDRWGGFYFTDPRYGNRDSMEMSVEGVYYINAKGEIDRVIDDLVRPNGIMIDNHGKTLYVADNGSKNIVAYDIKAPGKLANKRVFAWMDAESRGGGDGMTVDAHGNVYCAGQGGVWVWDYQGKLIRQIPIPEAPTNLTFGGKNNDTLFVTARTSLYAIQMGVKGRTRYGLPRSYD